MGDVYNAVYFFVWSYIVFYEILAPDISIA